MRPKASLSTLAELERRRFPELALSAYLPTEPGAGRRYSRARFEDLVRADRHKLTAAQRSALHREVGRVLAALEKTRFESPAVAVFSCGPAGLLSIWRLPNELPARIAVAEELDLAPIRLQLFTRPAALAVVFDKQEARLYSLLLNEVSELGRWEGLPISRHEQGGWSASTYQHRQDEHTRSNLRHLATVIADAVRADGYPELILCGPPEARSELHAQLPPRVRRLRITEAALPEYATGNELGRRLRELYRAGRPEVSTSRSRAEIMPTT